MSVQNVLPELQLCVRGLGLGSNVAGFCNGHLEHQTAAVVRDAAHHI